MFDGLKEFAELGSTVIVTLAFLFVIYESQKQKKNGINGKSGDILNELKLMNSNHLHSIENAIRDGNEKIITAINGGNTEVIGKLSEICGKLSK